MVAVVIILVLFIVVLNMKHKCPDCDGKMDDVDEHYGSTVYRCRECGKEWI